MTIENFNALSETEKVKLIFEANKISEKVDNEANYQLFQIDAFYVEVKTSLSAAFKRTFAAYSIKDLPAEYVGEVLSIPIVVLNDPSEINELKRSVSNTKKLLLL